MRRTIPRVMNDMMRRRAFSFQTSIVKTWASVQPRMMIAMVRKVMSLLRNPMLRMMSPTNAHTMERAELSWNLIRCAELAIQRARLARMARVRWMDG